MALVSYDYSDSENEEEVDDETSSSCVVINKNSQNSVLVHKPTDYNQSRLTNKFVDENAIKDDLSPTRSLNDENSTTAPEVESSLFSKLPEIKKSTEVIEDQIEDFIPRSKPAKVKEKVKISIPSLSEFADIEDDEPASKKAKPSSKGSCLISLLPPVKSSVMTTKSFVPNVVANKSKATPLNTIQDKPSTSSSSMIPHAVQKQAEIKRAQLMKLQTKSTPNDNPESDDDDVEIPETFDDEMWQKVCGRPKLKPAIIEPDIPEQPMLIEPVNIAPEPEKPYDGLDNKAFKELVGRTKRPIGNIKLIDINEEDVLPEKELWMTKALTDPEMEPKKQVENPVDPTRRRKHHITYLAQQAKANEQDLQNNWASSKNNRMMSRAKYGF